ncbi:hypothetical protein Pyn_31660 [Prunus yedoensis var. nudiflora]|uniref:Uncharacterized protein n=1 Tax=Prunus yedoensis var. nudiflora TaxID=2094558 RepID=A0A314XQX0_PRUYE|nr:hypothetical protein Pyn_31660 [Prunus yedoensis var. nudiflora]
MRGKEKEGQRDGEWCSGLARVGLGGEKVLLFERDFYPIVNVLIADLEPAYWGRILESCRPSLPARREATKALGQRL